MSNSNKKIALKSSDGEIFEIEETTVTHESQLIANMVEDGRVDNNVISLANVTGETLTKVIEYRKKHVDGGPKEELKTWDAEFMKNMDKWTTFDLIIAAKFLDIESLFDLSCETVADMLASKTPEEVRDFFNIKNDFTPKEEAKIREENSWAFE